MNRASVRLAIVQFVIIGAVFLILGVYLVRMVHDQQQSDWQIDIRDNAQRTASELERLLDQGGTLPADDDTLARYERPDSAHIALIDSTGELLAGSPVRDPETLGTEPDIAIALDGDAGAYAFTHLADDDEYRAFAIPINVDGEVAAVLVQTVPEDAAPPAWSSLARNIVLTLVIAGFVLAIASARAARALTGPIEQLTQIARRVSRGDLDPRAETDTYEELADLADAFNEVTDELRRQVHILEHERARLEAILEHLNDGILIVDPRGAISLINLAAERLLGVDRRRALVRTYAEVVRDYELVELIRNSHALYDADGPLPSRFIELGRPRRSVQAFAYPIAQGENELVIVILRDITELRRTETVRRDFVANVSHDLRTPIASLKALVETLLDGALEDETVARDFLSRMEVEVDDLARLVEELLELSRAESRRIDLHQIPSDVGYLIRRSVARLQTHTEPKSITVQLEIPDDLAYAFLDPDRIEQVLVNLLHNAVKFTPERGTITVRAQETGDMIRVAVSDDGPGIPPDELERVFERFYKGDQSRSNTGSGLGLAIAKHMIGLHGGQIWAESAHRRGATFVFTVPIASAEHVQEFLGNDH